MHFKVCHLFMKNARIRPALRYKKMFLCFYNCLSFSVTCKLPPYFANAIINYSLKFIQSKVFQWGGKNMRRILAVIAAKITIALVKLMGHRGSNIGGELALRMCPDILAWFGSKVKDKIIFVTGTNGKTSTNNMIYSIIQESGHSCICNRLGANLDSGLISAFINNSNWFGDFDADHAWKWMRPHCQR